MALPIATPAPAPMLPTPAAATPLPTPVPAATPAPSAPDGFDPDDYLKEMAAAPAASFDPDSYLKDSLQKYVDDDNFDPLTMAYEQPDKLDLAKEIEWRKSQRPMTGARAGKAVKNVAKAVPGIIYDFGAGAGAIAGDAVTQATDDTPANVERAKTQQLARAQLIEQHAGSFMGKLFGSDSWLGKNVFTPERAIKSDASYQRAALDRVAPEGPAKAARIAEINAKEKADLEALAAKPVESDRQASDRMFESKLTQVKRERELIKGNPQPDGAVAGTLQGIADVTRTLVTGEPVNDDLSAVTNTFKSGDQLNAMGAPVDQEAIRTGAVTADPINLLPLHVPGMNKLAGKIGGALLKTPATIAEKVAENTPEIVSNTLKKKVLGTAAVAGGGAITAEAIHDPAGAAKMLAAAGIATAGLAGAKYFGRVMDVAGSKLIDPKYISAAERAGAESAMNIEKSGGSKFFDPAMNKADLERALVKPIQGAVTAPIAMAPLNAALSDNPEEFGSLTGSAMGFGAFAGATAYNPAKGFHPETVAAVDSILRDNGAKKEYGTPLDAQHAAFMADAPEGVKDAVNSYRGFFDGFKLPNGREPQIYVLPAEQFGAEVAKRRPDVTPDVAAKQRGFAGKDGTILINGDYGGETPGILGHEAGGHVAQSIMDVLAPEVAKSMNDAALKGLTDASGNPTPKLKKFVDAYNKEFDPTGKTKEIQTTDHAISEWLAEQGRAVLEGQGPAKFAAGQSVRQTIGDNLADHFHKVFGTKQMFDRGQVPALARQYRDLLFSLGRFRTQEGPQTAPPEGQAAPGDPAAAPAPEAAAATPASPAGGEPAPAGSAGDRRTVSDAMMALFGVKRAEADAMAAAAKGSTVEQMVASAAQAKSKAVAGSRTTAPAAQPVPVQPAGAAVEPTGQLGAIKAAEPVSAAPAGQLAGVGESAPAVAAKPKMRVSRTPDGGFEYRDENGNLIPTDANGQPVRPGTAPDTSSGGRQGVATPPEAPARPVVAPEDITARVQAAEDAARTLEATKKRKTPESREKATAQAVKEARIQALLDAAHESAPDEAHLQKREEFGTTKYTGRIDESIPAHRMLLDELGVSKGGRDNIDTLNANMGKAVFIDYKSAAKEGSNEATQAAGEVDTTGKQRSKEYKAEPVDARIKDAQAGDVNTGVEQTKAFVPLGFRVNGSKGSVTVTGFSPNRLLANAGKIIGFMRSKGRETGYSGPDDPAIHDDMQGYAQNHANGYKGDGSGPIAGENPNSHYEPHIIDSTRFDLLNAAMGNEGAKTPKTSREGAQERAGDLQDFAAANDTLLTPEGETNPLRQWLNDNGFAFKNEAGEDRTGTKEVLEPTIESLRVDPELMRSVSTEAPEHEASLRPTGVADPSAMAAQGIPKARNVAAGFMPGQGGEKGQLSNFDGDKEEPSIQSKVTVKRGDTEDGGKWIHASTKSGSVEAEIKDDVLNIGDINVNEADRKNGVGRSLVDKMEEEAQDAGAHTITGDATTESVPFWKKLGFEVSGESQRLGEGYVHIERPVGEFMPGDKEPGDLTDFGKDKEKEQPDVEWAQPKLAKAAGDVVVQVKTDAFDKAFQKDAGFYIDKDGKGEIKGRRERFQEFLDKGQYDPKSGEYNKVPIEMPEAVVTKDGAAAFTNGRHRFSVMRDNGVESLPVSMDETSALRAQTLGLTVDSKQGDGKQLGSFMPGDATGRGEFDVKERKPLDERRARLMADMQGQAKWLGERAKEKGFNSIEDLMADDFDGYSDLAKQWRDDHPRFNSAGEQLFMPGKLKGATPKERDANFDKWTGDAPVIRVGDSLHDVESGQPVVIEGFHGTTHDFTAVDTSKANIENDWGKGFYVTNTPEDVESNYAGEGPDLTQRIERRVEQVEQEIEDMEPADIADTFGITSEQAQAIVDGEGASYGTAEYKAKQEALKAIAKKELTTHGGSTMKVFVKLENPLKLGGDEEHWDSEYPMDEEGEITGEPEGKMNDFVEALRSEAERYDDADGDWDDFMELQESGGTPSQAIAAAKKAIPYATDPETGDMASAEIIRAAIEQMGYDGIIDGTVNEKFGSARRTGKQMQGMGEDTFHVIAFRPESVKSATGNRGTFDGKNPDMTMMPGDDPRRTWFMRNGKRVYHHRDGDGQFAQKPALAKIGRSATSSQTDDEEDAKAQLQKFK